MYLSGFGRETLPYRVSVLPLIVTVFGTVIFRYPFVSPPSNKSVQHYLLTSNRIYIDIRRRPHFQQRNLGTIDCAVAPPVLCYTVESN